MAIVGSACGKSVPPSAPERSGRPKELQESDRRRCFMELVLAQDEGLTVKRSRAKVAGDHRLSGDQILAIEAEGLANAWAPL